MNFNIKVYWLSLIFIFIGYKTLANSSVTKKDLIICSEANTYYNLGVSNVITITEGANNDFQVSTKTGSAPNFNYSRYTFRLKLPAGFVFQHDNTNLNFSMTGSAFWVNNTLGEAFSMSFGSTDYDQVEFSYSLDPAADTEINTIKITGLKVKCITPGAVGDIQRISCSTGNTEAVINGINVGNNTFGNLSSNIPLAFGYNGLTTYPSSCKDGSVNFRLTLPASVPNTNVTYQVIEGSNTTTVTYYFRYSGGAFFNYKPLTTGTNVNYSMVINVNGCIYNTNDITIGTVTGPPAKAISTGRTPPTFTTFSDPVPLSDYLNPASGTTFSYIYSTRNGAYSNGVGSSGNNFFFLPSGAGKGNHILNYQVRDNVTGCLAEYVFPNSTNPTNFIVVDPLSPNPSFVSPQQTPICENGGYYRFNFNSSTTAAVSRVIFHYKNGDSIGIGNGTTSVPFNLNPTKQNNFIIPVTIEYSNLTSLLDTFYIFPKRDIDVKGLPTPVPDTNVDVDTVYLCSASKDTITVRGLPSSGNFNFLRYFKSTPTISRCCIYDFGTPYSSSTDPSTYKFVPNTLFKTRGNNSDSIFFQLMYTYPALGGGLCPVSKQIYIKFYNPTDLAYSIDSPTKVPYCYGDTLKLIGKSVFGTPALPDDSIQYTFGDGFTSGWIKADTIYSYEYKNPGQYSLRVRTNRQGANCNNDLLDVIRIGAKPIADFDVYKNFKDSTSYFKSLSELVLPNLFDTKDTINQWYWDFDFNGSTNYDLTKKYDTTHLYDHIQRDPFAIIHKVKSGWGCSDSVIKYTPVFDIKNPDLLNNYKEDFNGTLDVNSWYASGWYKRDTLKSSWVNDNAFGTLIKGSNANWNTTRYSIDNSSARDNKFIVRYLNEEISWVESPVFNLDSLSLPMVSFDSWVNADNSFDGVCFQYAICDSVAFGREQWKMVGEYNKGINWYNSFTVISRPDEWNMDGWSGTDVNDWGFSANVLDSVRKDLTSQNKKLVRFRVLFTSNKDNFPNKNLDGFAFDNFFIGQRNRNVVIEEFCDYKFFDTEDVLFSGTTKFNDNQAIKIQYHTASFNNDDDINIENPDEPSARALHYGVGKALPRGVIDGIKYYNSDVLSKWGPKEFESRALMTSPFAISVNAVKNGDALQISANLKKVDPTLKPKNYLVQIAVVESKVQGNGWTFLNVLRNLVPNAAGNRIDKSISWTDTTITGNWSPTFDPQSDYKIIAFIQDEDTKEIYQGNQKIVPQATIQAIKDNTKSGSLNEDPVSFNEMYISPNPVSQDLRVLFNGVLNENYKWVIIDSYGRQVITGDFNSGMNAAFIDTKALSSGIYQLQMEGEGRVLVSKFAVVK